MHRTWRLWSLRLTPDLFFWPKENRELRGGSSMWYKTAQVDVLSRCLLWVQGEGGSSTWYKTAQVDVLSRCLLWVQGGSGHTILLVTMLILEYSGLAVALCFLPID